MKSLIPFLLISILGVGAHAVEVVTPREETARDLGVTHLEIEAGRTVHEKRVRLFAAESLLGEATYRSLDSGRRLVDLQTATDRISIEWNPALATARVIEHGSGRVGETVGTFGDMSWTSDEGLREILAGSERAVLLAAVVFEAEDRQWSPMPGTGDPERCGIGGPRGADSFDCDFIYGCRGFAVSGSRSHCCLEAEQDVNHCCTNGHCWGCCALLPCDAGCGIGDYICFCGMSGAWCIDEAE